MDVRYGIGKGIKILLNFLVVVVLAVVFYKMETLNYVTTLEGFRDIFGGRVVLEINWAKELAMAMVMTEIIMVVALAFPGDLKTAPGILQLFVWLYGISVIPDAMLTWFFYQNELQNTSVNAPTIVAKYIPMVAPAIATLVNTFAQILIAIMFGQFIEILMKNFKPKKQVSESQNQGQQNTSTAAKDVAMSNFQKNHRGNQGNQPSYKDREPAYRR